MHDNYPIIIKRYNEVITEYGIVLFSLELKTIWQPLGQEWEVGFSGDRFGQRTGLGRRVFLKVPIWPSRTLTVRTSILAIRPTFLKILLSKKVKGFKVNLH
ncbi:hypothetical protein XELAEV_18013465mg [Xenopus laevis]|uniref:Uncharacterized protein n=1 Tax=Xenopus laevis TaxID=8355 RepID=A0A974HZM9_XENLA|nr:hypothetical protein XELAEV_18013465mg [Xenopus laevis]